MKAVAVLVGLAALGSVKLLGQGQFLFNAHDPGTGNNVQFEALCFEGPITSGAVLQVFAGLDLTSASLIPLTPTLTLDFPASAVVYPTPPAQLYTVPGLPGGTQVYVVYELHAGNQVHSYGATDQVVLTEPPAIPNQVALGEQSISIFYCPEPSAWRLALLGFASLLFPAAAANVARPRTPDFARA